ncbi:MAG TPA: hypothetical protein VEB64_00020 [Azospirillaceae bacterium]|nr:hypothetical protein [Azospirillaceae bacterium]
MIVPLLAAVILLAGGVAAFERAAPDALHNGANTPFALLTDGSPDSICLPRPNLTKPAPIPLKGSGAPEPCLSANLAARTAQPACACRIGLLLSAPPRETGLTFSRLPTGPPGA